MNNDAALAALRWVVEAYEKEEFMRTADMHPIDCRCLRCAVDNARAVAWRPK